MCYRSVILNQLSEQNKRINNGYSDLIRSYTILFDLSYYQKRQLDNVLKEASAGVVGGGDGDSQENLRAYEKKIFDLQQELSELYKKKGEGVEHVLQQNKELELKRAECATLKEALRRAQQENAELLERYTTLQLMMSELEAANKCLKDEYVVLQSSNTLLEEKYEQMKVEHVNILERWMNLKQREADIMNLENEVQIKINSWKLQTDIAEAAQPVVAVEPEKLRYEDYDSSLGCYEVVLPTVGVQRIDVHEGEVLCLKWSYGGTLFASGGSDRKIRLWECGSGDKKLRYLNCLTGCNQSVTSVDFSVDECLMLAGSNDYAVRVWTVADQRLRHTFNGHGNKVLTAKFTADQLKVISGSNDRTIKVWDVHSSACTHTFFPGSSCNDLVVLDSSGTVLISGHFDGKVRLWDSRASKPASIYDMGDKVTSLDLSADEKQFLCSSRDDKLTRFDLRKAKVIATYSDEDFKIGYDQARAVFSPEDKYCVCGSSSCNVFIWNVSSLKLEKTLSGGHTACVTACAWHPRGGLLATCDKHKTICLWGRH